MKRILFLIVCLLFGMVASAIHAQEGEGVYQRHCSWCHDPGMNNPGTQQLTKTRGEANGILIDRDNLVDIYVKTIVRQGLNAMPAFKPTQITESELDALAAFLAD
jgi:mono/diheme cytochrome c family protein